MMADAHPRIESKSANMRGKPAICDARVMVEQVSRECARGAGAAEIAGQYPRLKREDVAAALAFAVSY